MADRDLAAALGYTTNGGIVDALFGDVTGPARVNQNIARQVQRSRQAFARPQAAQGARGAIDYAAGITAGLPIIGDLFGLGRDIAQFRAEPESRTPLNFGLAALGLIPFVPPAVSYGLGRFAQSRGVEIAPPPSGPAASQAGAIVYHGSPSGPIIGSPRVSPHDETGIPGFSVSRGKETAQRYASDEMGRHLDLDEINPTITPFEIKGRVADYGKFWDRVSKHYKTEFPTQEQILEYAKKRGVVALDHSSNLGLDEISVLFPEALVRVQPQNLSSKTANVYAQPTSVEYSDPFVDTTR